ncbi:hypothetical protein E4U17_001140 [Claviceps sp. LM77 group G4]|nr:hypothetical protein E4U17_001140 [Claviceps sp. LM77 group G4]KAG6061263.1 hypothetical protein E4U33_006717 [Claviceps sp. LM78 group G4]KAG6071101.1 hypothetical protein E4U16_006362 [Claviceps sp. LM84 group G4]
MSSPIDASTSSRDTGAGAEEKPRLTEVEKKQNHIASEQKRRQAIREGFDRLTFLVPGLEGQGRSEGLVLKRTVEYIRQQMQERCKLIERIELAGGHVDDELKRLFHKPGVLIETESRPEGELKRGYIDTYWTISSPTLQYRQKTFYAKED